MSVVYVGPKDTWGDIKEEVELVIFQDLLAVNGEVKDGDVLAEVQIVAREGERE